MHKTLWNIIGWLLGLIAFTILMQRLYQSFSKTDLQYALYSLQNTHNIYLLSLATMLMPINWGIEMWKWYKISHVVENVSFKKAALSVLVGLAYGHLLSGRTSEFLGKWHFFSTKNRTHITVLHFINGAFQMYITLIIGTLFLLFYFKNDISHTPYAHWLIWIDLIIFLLLSILLIYADKLYLLQKIFPSLQYKIPHSLKVKLLLWSLLRYSIFILQFYLVFLIFNPHQNFNLHFISQTSLYYMLTSIIPMISIIEIAVRSLIGILAFHASGINDVSLTFITTLIWTINLAIPSIVGFIIWIYIKQK